MRKKRIMTVMSGIFLVLFSVLPVQASGVDVPVVIGSAESPEVTRILQELTGKQSQETISNAIFSGRNMVALVDSETAEYLSIVEVEPAISTFAISQLGPVCSTLSACIDSSSTHYGYTETGTLIKN